MAHQHMKGHLVLLKCCIKIKDINDNFFKCKKQAMQNQGYLNTIGSLQNNTRCSAIAERPRCRVRYSFCQK